MSSPECPTTPELEEPTKWSDTPSPPAPSPMASNSQGNWSWIPGEPCIGLELSICQPQPKQPQRLGLGYLEEREELLSWWQEFRSLYKDFPDGLTNDLVPQSARKHAMAFRLTAVQEEIMGWWAAPLSIHGLGQQDFLPHHDFHGTRDLRETWKE